jgi:AcrR family transcriptional regulator
MIAKLNMRSPGFRQRRHDATAQVLVGAAEAVMTRQGYDRVTMRDIAAEAGCSPGTLYIYFQNKQEVLDAIGTKHSRELLAEMRQSMAAAADPLTKLRAMLTVLVAYVSRHRGAFRLVRGALRAQPGTLRTTVPAGMRQEWQAFWAEELEVIRQAQARGLLRQDFTPEAIQTCWSVGVVALLDEFGFQEVVPEVTEQERLIWGFVEGGIGRG